MPATAAQRALTRYPRAGCYGEPCVSARVEDVGFPPWSRASRPRSLVKMTTQRRILLVDDSPRVRATIRAVLAGLASEVEECFDGDQVLAAYEAFRPHLVLMD